MYQQLCLSGWEGVSRRNWGVDSTRLAKQQEVERKEIQIPGVKKCNKRRDFFPLWINLKVANPSIKNKNGYLFSDSVKNKHSRGEEGSKPHLDNYKWQADLWLEHPVTSTAGWEVNLRKHCPLHLSVIFDLILQSSMKSVCPRANSRKCLSDESLCMCVCVCKVCVYTLEGLKGHRCLQSPFFPLRHPRMP